MKQVRNRFNELLAVKERKEARSISRRQIAEETGISLTSIHNWATNQVTRYDGLQIKTFCEYFNCNVGDLLIIEEASEQGQRKTLLASA
jgi:putative transcriptional regulator